MDNWIKSKMVSLYLFQIISKNVYNFTGFFIKYFLVHTAVWEVELYIFNGQENIYIYGIGGLPPHKP